MNFAPEIKIENNTPHIAAHHYPECSGPKRYASKISKYDGRGGGDLQ